MTFLTREPERLAPEASQTTDDRAPDWVAAGTPEPLRSGLIDALGHDTEQRVESFYHPKRKCGISLRQRQHIRAVPERVSQWRSSPYL